MKPEPTVSHADAPPNLPEFPSFDNPPFDSPEVAN